MVIAANNRGTCYVYRPTDKSQNNNKPKSNGGLMHDGNGNGDDDVDEYKNSINNIINGGNASQRNMGDLKHLVTTHNSRADKNGMYTLTHKIAAHDTYCLKCLLSPD